ncbi:hypothetical protein LENED_005793 [Lentinula edodes]|uniref:Uncharacterized protein n=1 Tax=Lentinula edodes TaxID=5353 RepID=A0A1Q3EA45_LENED|nr:hypothetical protein LENED_005793 [Lentinula edodes]
MKVMDLHIDVKDGERLSLPFLTLIVSLDPGWILNSSKLTNSRKGYGFVKREKLEGIMNVFHSGAYLRHVTCLLMSNEFLGLQTGLTELRKTSTLLLGLSISTVWEWNYMRNLLAETIGVSKPRMAFSFLLADCLVQGYVYPRIRGCFGPILNLPTV